MATVTIPFTFVNNTQNADATQVNSNFSTLASFLNTEVIQRDASVAFTQIPTLPSTTPTLANHATRKGYVDSFFPVTSANIADGAIMDIDVNASANIARAKLNLTGTLVAADFAASARPVVICTSGARPTTGLVEGQIIYETDTDRVYVYSGTAWVLLLAKGTYTPTLTSMAVGTGGSAYNSANWTYSYGTLFVSGRVTFGTSGTTFPSSPTISLPPNFTPEFVTQEQSTPVGQGWIFIDGGNYLAQVALETSTTFKVVAHRYDPTRAVLSYVNHAALLTTVPDTWIAGSEIRYSLTVAGTMT